MHHHVQAETKTLFRIILWYRILILLSPSHKWAQGSRSYKMCASSTDENEETDPWIQLSAIKPDIVRFAKPENDEAHFAFVGFTS